MAFIKKIKKTFYEFKLIEIINEREVKEHFSFIHPYYESMKLIYFSSDGRYMYERLINSRLFIYERSEKAENGRVS